MRQASNSTPQYVHPFSPRAGSPLRASHIIHQLVIGYGVSGSGRPEPVIQEPIYRPLLQR